MEQVVPISKYFGKRAKIHQSKLRLAVSTTKSLGMSKLKWVGAVRIWSENSQTECTASHELGVYKRQDFDNEPHPPFLLASNPPLEDSNDVGLRSGSPRLSAVPLRRHRC